MKKQLLLAVAFMATTFGATAQLDANFETIFGIPDATVLIEGEGVVKSGIRFFADTRVVDGEIVTSNHTMKYEKNTKTFTDANGENKVKYNTRLSFNGKAIGIDEEGGMPKTRIIQFKPTSAGTLKVAIQQSAGRNLVVSKYNNGTLTQIGKIDAGTVVGSGSGNDANPWLRGEVNYATYTEGDEIWIYADQNIYFWGFTFSGTTDAAYTGTLPDHEGVSIAQSNVEKEVVAVEYYSTTGVKMDAIQSGINIVKNIYADGSVAVSKVYNK